MIKNISNHNSRYLHNSVFDEIFNESNRGTIKYFDKVKTGIGATTSFHNILVPQGKINIIISANRGMILDKEQSNTDSRVSFICTDSKDSEPKKNTRLVYITPESLRALWDSHFSHLEIDKVLVDEFHSIVIQSPLRKELRLYRSKLKSMFPNSIVCLMTATPLLYQEVDYRLTDVDMQKQTWNVNPNAPQLTDEIKSNVNQSKLTNVFSNSSSFFLSLKETINRKNHLNMKLKTGGRMALNIYRKATVTSSEILMGISSNGFEGWDDNREKVHNYFIQDLNNDNETFGIESIYQSTTRTRKGAELTTLCRIDKANDIINTKRLIESVNSRNPQAQDFVNKTSIVKKFKVSNTEFRRIKELYTVTHSKGELTLHFDYDLYCYYVGLYDYIVEGFANDKVKEFLSIRNVHINFIEAPQKKCNSTRVKFNSERYYLESNAYRIEQEGLCNDDFIINTNYKIEDVPLNVYKQLKRRLIVEQISQQKVYGINERLLKSVELFETDGAYDSKKTLELINQLKKKYKKIRSDKKKLYSNRTDKRIEIQEKTDYILNRFEYIYYGILCDIINYNRTEVGSVSIMHRTFGNYVDLSVEMIEVIYDLFNISTTEIDIKSCAVRILYAVNGLKVPSDLYGENKRLKNLINKNLNQVYYKKPYFTRRDLSNLGIDNKVIEYLIDNFYGKNSDAFYLFYTEYEEQIINELTSELNHNIGLHQSVRRHDSILLFNQDHNTNKINNTLSRFTFLNTDSWFDLLEDTKSNYIEDVYDYSSKETEDDLKAVEQEQLIDAHLFNQFKDIENNVVETLSAEQELEQMFNDLDDEYFKKKGSTYFKLLNKSSVYEMPKNVKNKISVQY